MTEDALVPLNRTEHLFWAGEGYMGSITIPYLLRFDGPIGVAQVRQALRELASAYPRLRAVMVPTGLTYKLKILPDDWAIEQLIDDALRIQHGVDPTSSAELEAFHTAVINEHLSMERGLPWRVRFVPHPQQPALIFSLHHIIGDGRSNIQVVSAIMARLNGHPIKPCPLHSPSMVPAVVPEKWSKWPASIAGWWRNTRQDARAKKGQELITLATRHSPHFTTARLHHHQLPCSQVQLKALAKQMGTTVNSLFTAVLANGFLARQPSNPRAVAAIRISLDLRRHFPKGTQPEIGNFVSSFAVRATHQASLAEQIQAIEAQVKEQMSRYARREYAVPLLLYEILPLMGRRLYSLMIMRTKARGGLRDVSCHFSNLGAAETIHPPDPTIRITELWPTAQGVAPLFGFVSLGDKLFLSVNHQTDEVSADTITQFLQALDRQLMQLVQPRSA